MKRKSKLALAVLSTAGFAALMGVSVGAATLNGNVNNDVARPKHALVANQGQQEAQYNDDYKRSITDADVKKGFAEVGGIRLELDASGHVLSDRLVDGAASLKTLRLYEEYGQSAHSIHAHLDCSTLVNCTDIIVGIHKYKTSFVDLIKAVPSAKNLYNSGVLPNSTDLASTNIENIYLTPVCKIGTDVYLTEEFSSALNTTKIKKIYYNDVVEKHNMEEVTAFNSANHVNANGEAIKMEKMTSCKYPEEVFYVAPNFNELSSMYGADGYFVDNNKSTYYNYSNIYFIPNSFDDKLVSLDLTSKKMLINNSNISGLNLKKVFINDYSDNNYSGVKADELVIDSLRMNSFIGSQFNNVKTLRFAKPVISTISSVSISESSQLTKIMIPKGEEEKFATLTSNPTYGSMCEVYDDSKAEAPVNSYLSDDGNTYKVKNPEFTIGELETAKNLLVSMGLKITPEMNGIYIDEFIHSYEIPIHDYSEAVKEYSLRNFDTIVLPKTMNLENVLNAFKDLVILNHGFSTDSTGLTITNESKNYKPGTDGSVDLVITMPGSISERKTVNIKTIDTTEKVAYVMDGNDAYVIMNPTAQSKDLKAIMTPLMTLHLNDATFNVEASSILNTTSMTYVAPNKYTGQSHTGAAKVFVTNKSLTEAIEPETPPTNPDVNPRPDTSEVDPDGIWQVLKIDKIFTNTEINGRNIINQLRGLITLKNGVHEEISFGIGHNNEPNDKNYQFSIYHKFSNKFYYETKVSVDIIPTDINVGFVKLNNGDIVMIYNHFERYDQARLDAQFKKFMTEQNLNVESAKLPIADSQTKMFKGSYDKGNIYYINSGVNIAYTSPDKPTDQTEVKKGYVAMDNIYYTKGHTVEEALRAFGDRLLLKDGVRVDGYKVEYTQSTLRNEYTYTFTDANGAKLATGTVRLQEIESDYDYIFAKAYEFDTGILLINRLDKAPKYILNDVLRDVIVRFRGLSGSINTTAKLDFTKENQIDLRGTYQYGNGEYYNYDYRCEVADLVHEIKTNDVLIDGKAYEAPNTADKIKDWFSNLGENIKNNKAYKAATIVLGTITGALLIWGLVVIFRKLHKWLKRR